MKIYSTLNFALFLNFILAEIYDIYLYTNSTNKAVNGKYIYGVLEERTVYFFLGEMKTRSMFTYNAHMGRLWVTFGNLEYYLKEDKSGLVVGTTNLAKSLEWYIDNNADLSGPGDFYTELGVGDDPFSLVNYTFPFYMGNISSEMLPKRYYLNFERVQSNPTNQSSTTNVSAYTTRTLASGTAATTSSLSSTTKSTKSKNSKSKLAFLVFLVFPCFFVIIGVMTMRGSKRCTPNDQEMVIGPLKPMGAPSFLSNPPKYTP